MSEPEPIGQARLESDGTIVLDLWARDGEFAGIAQERIAPGSPGYQETLDHIGGLRPGEEKLVPPWPDQEGT